jgi:hypothetical protein
VPVSCPLSARFALDFGWHWRAQVGGCQWQGSEWTKGHSDNRLATGRWASGHAGSDTRDGVGRQSHRRICVTFDGRSFRRASLDQPRSDDASGGAGGLAEDLAAADARAAAAASKAAGAIGPGLQTARGKMVDALSLVAPEAALHLLRTPEAVRRIEGHESSRFGWLLATMGRGSGAAISDWNRFAEVCQIWLGEFTAASLVRTGSGSALTGIATMAPLLRLGPSSTRLRWAADVLCEGIGEWADASGNEALRPFSSSSMRAVNASVTRLLDQPHAVADESTFSGIDVRLLTWLTAEPMRKGSADFEMHLLSTDPDTHPLVTIGGRLQPVNAGAWYFNRELGIGGFARPRGLT